MRKTLQAAAVAALFVGGVAQAAVVTTIDMFTTNQVVTDTTTGDGAVTNQTAAAEAIGGFRELIVEKKTGANPNNNASMNVFGGELSFNTGSGTTGTGVVRWDGASTGGAIDTGGLGGVFVGNALTDFFQLDVKFSDSGFLFVLEAYTSANQWSTVSIVSNAHPVPATTYIPLAAFLDCTNAFPVPGVTVACGAGGAVDFTNVGALQAVIDPNGTFTALDLTLGQVQVVPEPGALALVGLALAGAGLASRRRKA